MCRLWQKGSSLDPRFRIRGSGPTALLVRIPDSGSEQLVLPALGGFREIMLAELHDSAMAGHLGAAKTTSALL